MSGMTRIEWADRVWNPVTGCTPVSEGCRHCYAARMAKRLAGRCGYPADEPFKVTLHRDKLEEPFHWKKTQRVFVNSMGDLFHPDVPDEFIDRIFHTMKNSKHTFIVLTKRPERMLAYVGDLLRRSKIDATDDLPWMNIKVWPLPNVWLGVTAENQQMADERIPLLLQTPATVRFVSIEPMLGPVDLQRYLERCHAGSDGECNHPSCPQNRDAEPMRSGRHCPLDTWPEPEEELKPLVDWVICGGETGPGARPIKPGWVRSLRDQCQVAGVPFFFKGWGEFIECEQSLKNDVDCNDKKWIIPFTWEDKRFRNLNLWRMGRGKTGRLLDGEEWSQFPGIAPLNPPISKSEMEGGLNG